jgi:hypothetical protein
MERTPSRDSSTEIAGNHTSRTQTKPRGRAERLVSLSQLATDQHRVVSRDQLHSLGWSHQHVEHEINIGRWTRVAPTVVALQNAPLVHEQRLWLGVLHASPRGALTHATACQALGLERWDCSTIDVLTPKGDLVSDLEGFFFHQTRRDYSTWIHAGRQPATLMIEAAALLAAERDRHVRRGIGRLAAVVQQRLSTPERLLVTSLTINKLRNGKILRLALGDIAGGAQSFAELEMGRICESFGLMAPHRQRVRKDQTGRRRYLDCEWDLSDGRILVLEIDGSFHLETENWWQDMKRERAVVISGRTVLRCSSVEIRLEPFTIVHDLRQAGVPSSMGLVA